MQGGSFLFACCQRGAEPALKQELAEAHPDWRFAFSRPGFLTFKWTGPRLPSSRLQLKSVFARCHGWSLGPIQAESPLRQAETILTTYTGQTFQHLHVWQRKPEQRSDGMPELFSPATDSFGNYVLPMLVSAGILPDTVACNQPATSGQFVIDCMMIGPNQWWLGWHCAGSFGQRWPGGVPRIERHDDMVSRAYLKIREAAMWSAFPMQRGDRCVELGSAPGGTSQALLEMGMLVTGVDPAEMNPLILGHPRFTHVRKRAGDVKRRDYRGFKWLIADSNISPALLLETVESIVTHPSTRIQGMLLTLKLTDWRMAHEVAQYAQRVRAWGFADVRCRQLASNHHEVCLAALRSRGDRRRKPGRGTNHAARQ